jgi:hypothetical protein
MSLQNEIPVKLQGIIARRTGDEYVLVPVTDNIADMTSLFTLNDTGAFVWDLIDGTRSVSDLAEAVASEYNIPIEVALADVEGYVAQLHEFLITE